MAGDVMMRPRQRCWPGEVLSGTDTQMARRVCRQCHCVAMRPTFQGLRLLEELQGPLREDIYMSREYLIPKVPDIGRASRLIRSL